MQLPHKYKHEIHANEIVLLAYYIAAINIEAVYHALVGGKYEPFQGICLTDTFQLYEKGDMISDLLTNNSDRRKRQKALDIRVIVGNPPYSAGQESANDNNQNVAYPELDRRISETYVENSSATNNNALYDSYIRAIRWASDRIGTSGVIGFVTNGGFLEANTADGLRKCLATEFCSIYVFHLRGNQRTSGEMSRKEGGKIFGSGSRAPIAITLLVKKPTRLRMVNDSTGLGKQSNIFWHDIGDYLSQNEKFDIINRFKSIAGITLENKWRSIIPDEHNDWTKQRDSLFSAFIEISNRDRNGSTVIFKTYCAGVQTNRDPWCQNSSETSLLANIKRMITTYNSDLKRLEEATQKNNEICVDDVITTDDLKISWTRGLKSHLSRNRVLSFDPNAAREILYRPFFKRWIYFDRKLNEYVNQFPNLIPRSHNENRVIVITGKSDKGFSALISDSLVDVQTLFNDQCFPLYLYDKPDSTAPDDLFSSAPATASPTRRDAITDAGLAHFQAAYPAPGEGDSITKEDLFYYIYGLLHSPDYRTRFADNLGKELPRIPADKTHAAFAAFSRAGRDLAHWHLHYETVAMYPDATVEVAGKDAPPLAALSPADFRVVKMKFAKVKDPETGKSVNDKSTVFYNAKLTIRNIPLSAYDYVVNGKPALEWVMERQSVTTDKASGITNDANLWATETMGNAKYPLELFLRVITVSLETNRIVESLPKLELP